MAVSVEPRPGSSSGDLATPLAIAALVLGLLASAQWLVAPWPMPADAGEFQFVSRHLGIAHPPGYPLYTLLGHVFGRAVLALTGGRALSALAGPPEPVAWAWSQNLLALVFAIITLGAAFAASRRLSGGTSGGWLGLLLLAAMPTFVAQSTVAGIRMPTTLLTALFLALILGNGPFTARKAALAGFLLALAVGHHPSLVLLAVPGAVMAFSRRASATRGGVLAAGLGFIVGLLPLAYLPIRDAAGAVLAPGGLTTPAGLFAHISGYGFRGDVLYFGDLATLWDRLAMLANVMSLQFGLGGLLIVLGAAWTWRRNRAAAVALLAFATVSAASAVVYRAPQTVEYLLPSYVALALLAAGAMPALEAAAAWRGALANEAQRELSARSDPAVASNPSAASGAPAIRLVLALTLAVLAARTVWLAVEVTRANRAQASHVSLPIVRKYSMQTLAGWHFAPPLWVAASEDERDPRGIVRQISYVNPEGDEPYGRTWLRRALRAQAGMLVLTNRTTDVMEAELSLWPLPLQAGYLTMTRAPTTSLGGNPRLAESIPAIHLPIRDHDLRSPIPPHATVKLNAADAASLSGAIRMRLQWIAQSPVTETVTGWAQLVDPATGAVWAQADQALGEVPMPVAELEGTRYAQFDLVPFRGAVPSRLGILAGLYTSGPDGPGRWRGAQGDSIDLGQIDLKPLPLGLSVDALVDQISRPASGALSAGLPVPAAGQVPFGNAMTLADTRVEVIVPPESETATGGEIVVDLTWRCDAPPASDYTVSVQIVGDGWLAQDDGTPAMGAIPTLKWLPGMAIHDRHRVKLRPGSDPATGFSVRVAVYDAFSLEPLPVTDGERVRRGEGQAAVVWP